jgi:hypothetical protein
MPAAWHKIQEATRLYADEPFGAELQQAAYALDSTTIDFHFASKRPYCRFFLNHHRHHSCLTFTISLVYRAFLPDTRAAKRESSQ